MDKKDEEYLVKSLQLERYAIQRYTKQRESITDPNVNKIIEGFLRTEIMHEKEILEFLGPKAGDMPANGFGMQEAVSTKITKGLRTVMGFLTLDLDFEKYATQVYSDAAKNVKDKKIKKFFQDTLRAEAGHVNLLSRTLRDMEKGIWHISFYCPICGDEISYGQAKDALKKMACKSCAAEFDLKKEKDDFYIGELKPFC